MKYLVIFDGQSKWINDENFDGKCLVINIITKTWSKDGKNWYKVEEDML